MQPVRVDDLAMASAIDIARSEGGPVYPIRFSADTPVLEAVRLSDVLYVPSAVEIGQSLQIIRGRYLPIEALFDQWTAEFVKPRVLQDGTEQFADFVESKHAGDVCILGNMFSRNFGHFHEELMKVVAIEQAGIDCTYVISDLGFAAELLELFGIPASRIIEVRVPTRFSRALFSTPVSYRNVSEYPDVLLALRDRLLRADVSGQPNYSSKLWLDRDKHARLGRRLVNPEEVHALLEKYEFQRLDMGSLPLRAQISAAKNARVMAGPHGSALVHSQLMPHRSCVIECFSPLYLNPTFTEIYRVLRHQYSQLTDTNTPTFPYAYGGDVRVDCQQLDLALRAATS